MKIEPLKGRVTHTGDICVDGDIMIGIFVECSREDLSNMANMIFLDVEVQTIEADK